jgi:GTP-binding protein YchF
MIAPDRFPSPPYARHRRSAQRRQVHLFNAVTRTRKAQAANYPFCTIDPNVGVVTVPDDRLYVLQKIAKTSVVIPAAIEFVDIAGLVKGAATGEGLGNKFLSHIREVDAIVQVVRCFEDVDIHHVSGTVDPVRDIEIINTELMLADLDSRAEARDRISQAGQARRQGSGRRDAVLPRSSRCSTSGKPALTCELTAEEKAIAKHFCLLTDKPTIFACNVKDRVTSRPPTRTRSCRRCATTRRRTSRARRS